MYKCIPGNPLGITETQLFLKEHVLEESILLKSLSTEEMIIVSEDEFEDYFEELN